MEANWHDPLLALAERIEAAQETPIVIGVDAARAIRDALADRGHHTLENNYDEK